MTTTKESLAGLEYTYLKISDKEIIDQFTGVLDPKLEGYDLAVTTAVAFAEKGAASDYKIKVHPKAPEGVWHIFRSGAEAIPVNLLGIVQVAYNADVAADQAIHNALA